MFQKEFPTGNVPQNDSNLKLNLLNIIDSRIFLLYFNRPNNRAKVIVRLSELFSS